MAVVLCKVTNNAALNLSELHNPFPKQVTTDDWHTMATVCRVRCAPCGIA